VALSHAYTRPEPTEPKKIKISILYVSAYICTEPIARPEIRVGSDFNRSNMFEFVGRKLVILYYFETLINKLYCVGNQFGTKIWGQSVQLDPKKFGPGLVYERFNAPPHWGRRLTVAPRACSYCEQSIYSIICYIFICIYIYVEHFILVFTTVFKLEYNIYTGVYDKN